MKNGKIINKWLRVFLAVQFIFAPVVSQGQQENNAAASTNAPQSGALPILHLENEAIDPETGERQHLELYYGTTQSAEEVLAAQAFVKDKLKESAARGEDPNLTQLTFDYSDGAEPVEMPIEPQEWHVRPERVSKTTVFVQKFKQLRNFITEHPLYRRATNRFDNFVEYLMTKEVPNPYRWLSIFGIKTRKTVELERVTFAFARLTATAGVTAMGFIAMKDLGLPGTGIVIGSLYMGSFSHFLMWNREWYLDWMDRTGRFSKYVLRAPLLAAYRLLGKSDAQVAAFDQRIQSSAAHYFMNTYGKYVFTEHGFFDPVILLFAALGASLYPEIFSAETWTQDFVHFIRSGLSEAVINGVTYGLESGRDFVGAIGAGIGESIRTLFSHTLEGAGNALATLKENIVQLNWTLFLLYSKAFFSQGVWDAGIALQRRGQLDELTAQLASGRVDSEEFGRRERRINFNSAAKVLAVAIAANAGVIMAAPDSEIVKMTGNMILAGVFITGVRFMTVNLYRYNSGFRQFLDRFAPKIKNVVKTCQQRLTPRVRTATAK